MTLTEWTDFAQIIQSVVTVIAIVAGAIWGYWLFVKNRQRYPRAHIEHTVYHRRISDEKLLLHVSVRIRNLGNVLLSLVSLEARVQVMFPLPTDITNSVQKGLDPVSEGGSEIAWPLVESREVDLSQNRNEIEPGEFQDIDCDFFLRSDIEVVVIYTYLKNVSKRDREIGWDLTTICSLTDREGSVI